MKMSGITNKYKLLFHILSSLATNRIYKLNFAITKRCNSRCKTCNNWFPAKDEQKTQNELTLAEIDNIFDNLGYSFAWVSITGGEPFLRDDIVDIVKILLKRMPELKVLSIISNGLDVQRVVKKIREILELNIPSVYLKFSIDGLEEIHNIQRGIENAFSLTMETYTEVLELKSRYPNLDVGPEATISQYNAQHLSEFLEWMKKRGDDLTVTICHNSYLYDNASSEQKLTPTQYLDDVKKVISLLKNNLKPFKMEHHIQRYYLDNIINYLTGKPIPFKCTASQASIALNADGNVFPCLMWDRPLGSLREAGYDLNAILQGAESIDAQKAIMESRCPLCWTPCEAYQAIFNHIMAPFARPQKIRKH